VAIPSGSAMLSANVNKHLMIRSPSYETMPENSLHAKPVDARRMPGKEKALGHNVGAEK
jgi:hypothetical protein